MPSIGFVTKQKDGNFKGQLRTLSFIAPIDILLNPTKSGSIQPDFGNAHCARVVSYGYEPVSRLSRAVSRKNF